jgi:hypothetical protein
MEREDVDTALSKPIEQPAAPAELSAAPDDALAIVAFWIEAGRERWFAKDEDFDRKFRERFMPLYEKAAQGELSGWLATATGALALILLLDQFPRNAFRNTPRMYFTDADAPRRRRRDYARPRPEDSARTSPLRLPALRALGGTFGPGADNPARPRARRGDAEARRAPPRHHQAVRTVPASQPDFRQSDARGGAALSG